MRRNLLDQLGADRLLVSVTPGDADEFRVDLLGKLGENTVRRNCGRAKQFFPAAIRKKLITENPFADMKGCAVKATTDRFFFVTREIAEKVIDACPDAEWRLIFALSRFGGLRCPSEHLALCWGDVDWQRSRITVHSPKTRASRGKGKPTNPTLPGIAALPSGRLRTGPGGHGEGLANRPCYYSLSVGQREPSDPTGADRSEGGTGALAQAVPELPVKPGDRAGRGLPDPCSLCLDRQHPTRRGQALSSGPRRGFRAGGAARRRFRRTRDAKYDAATNGRSSRILARSDTSPYGVWAYARMF